MDDLSPWSDAKSWNDVVRTIRKYLLGEVSAWPSHPAPLEDEIQSLIPALLKLLELGIISLTSQPSEHIAADYDPSTNKWEEVWSRGLVTLAFPSDVGTGSIHVAGFIDALLADEELICVVTRLLTTTANIPGGDDRVTPHGHHIEVKCSEHWARVAHQSLVAKNADQPSTNQHVTTEVTVLCDTHFHRVDDSQDELTQADKVAAGVTSFTLSGCLDLFEHFADVKCTPFADSRLILIDIMTVDFDAEFDFLEETFRYVHQADCRHVTPIPDMTEPTTTITDSHDDHLCHQLRDLLITDGQDLGIVQMR